ncbi:MAG: tail fiber domain-containing protein [Bergeyella sp.]
MEVRERPFFSADGNRNVVNIRKNSTERNQNVLNVYGDTTLQGTVKATSYMTVGYPTSFRPNSTDKLFVDGSTRANAYYYNSDARYKANIALLETPLEKVLSLHGYSYYNKLSEKNDIGVIAQEVEKAFPELVQTDSEGYKSVSYGNLVAPIIEAIRELSNKIDALTVSVNNLFDKYADQQAQISSLEARLQALEANK